MSNRVAGLTCAMGIILAPLQVKGTAIRWPDLPKECFVSARPATVTDMKKGCAAFMMGQADTSTGAPLNIKIPQYAWHVDQKTGEKTPVIVIQAEQGAGIAVVGLKEVGSSSLEVALLKEMILLGGKKPNQ